VEAVRHAYLGRLALMPLAACRWEPGTPPAVKLRDFIRAFLTSLFDYPGPDWHLELMMRELARPTPACVQFVREFARPQFELALCLLDEFLPPEVPPVKRHLPALSVIAQCVHHRLARPVITFLVGEEEYRTYSAARLAEHITEFSL